jgi:hypothetical protein
VSDWGDRDDDDWFKDRQRQGLKEELSRPQKLCKWLLEKTFVMAFIAFVLSFAVGSLIPLCVFFAVESAALFYLLVFN